MLLLGAGPAHVQVLRQWAATPLAGAEALCVVPAPVHTQAARVAAVVAGRCTAAATQADLGPLAAAARVRLVEGQPLTLDTAARRVQLADGRSAEYDLLSLDAEPATARDTLPGARGQALFARPAGPLLQLLPGLLDLAARRVIDIVVVGGGAAGCELALALQHRLSQRGEEQARVALVLGGARPLPGWPAGAVARLEAWLVARRITLFRERAAAIEPGAVWLASGARLACDAPIVATGPAPPSWLAGSGLALDEAGWPRTGTALQSESHAEVLVAGEGGRRAGRVLAVNLQRLAGGGELQAWRPRPACRCVDVGDGQALLAWRGAWLGGHLAGWLQRRLGHSA